MRQLTRIISSNSRRICCLSKASLPKLTFQQFKPLYAFTTDLHQTKVSSEVNGSGFYMQQLFTGCLAEFAYYIESNGEAIVIDPLRDVSVYTELAKKRGAKLKYVALTHFHADFVSGHLGLKREGAQVIMGPNSSAAYIDHTMKDEEEIQLGQVKLRLIHTPGHTEESSCYLLIDRDGKPLSIFTGDTVFLGEVGRPDLAVRSNLTKQDLARMLYDSIHNKILTLSNDITIYPGHGAGSACGKNISSGYSCTIGNQKISNYAMQPMLKEEFVQIVLEDLQNPPSYFFYNVSLNKKDNINDVEKILTQSDNPLSPQMVNQYIKDGVLVLDSRTDISEGFIKGSVNISFKMPFASWVGQLFKPDQKIIVLTDKGFEEQTILRLARIGYDNIVGYLDGGIESWKDQGFQVSQINFLGAKEFMEKQTYLVDIRTPQEWKKGYIEGSLLLQLNELEKNVKLLPSGKHIDIYCGTGQRTKIAVTLLSKLGITDVNACKVGYTEIIDVVKQ